MSLLAMTGALAMVNMRRGVQSATTSSLADRLAAELRQARSEAIRDNAPVAVVFPDGDFSQGLYVLKGHQRGRHDRSVNWSSEVPGTGIFWGYWSLDGAITEGNDNRAPRSAGQEDGFDASSWTMPYPSHAALIFTPSGACVSNGMVHFDGAYHLVAVSGLEAGPAAVPSGGVPSALNYRIPTRMREPHTVSVSFRGDIHVRKGLYGNDGTVALNEPTLGTPATLPTFAVTANNDPVVVPADVEVLPVADPALLPPGVMTTVDVERYLTIRIAATDPDGDPLFVDWTATDGVFSGAGLSAMEWSPERNQWEAAVEWRPPTTAVDGQIFDLNCTVSDRKGGAVTIGGGVVAALRVAAVDQGLIATSERYKSTIQVFNSDGSGVRDVDLPDTVCTMCVTPDGERLLFSFWGGGPYHGDIGSLNLDNTNVRLIKPGASLCEPNVAPSGRIALTNGGIWTMNGDGTGMSQVTNLGTDLMPKWSPDESRILFARTSTGEVATIKPDGTGYNSLTAGADACWSPQGDKIAFKRSNGIYTMDPDGSNVTHLVNQSAGVGTGSLTYSPDGTKLAWIRLGSGAVYTCNSADGSDVKQIQSLSAADCIVWAR